MSKDIMRVGVTPGQFQPVSRRAAVRTGLALLGGGTLIACGVGAGIHEALQEAAEKGERNLCGNDTVYGSDPNLCQQADQLQPPSASDAAENTIGSVASVNTDPALLGGETAEVWGRLSPLATQLILLLGDQTQVTLPYYDLSKEGGLPEDEQLESLYSLVDAAQKDGRYTLLDWGTGSTLSAVESARLRENTTAIAIDRSNVPDPILSANRLGVNEESIPSASEGSFAAFFKVDGLNIDRTRWERPIDRVQILYPHPHYMEEYFRAAVEMSGEVIVVSDSTFQGRDALQDMKGLPPFLTGEAEIKDMTVEEVGQLLGTKQSFDLIYRLPEETVPVVIYRKKLE